ncbi:MAG: DoxX family protein [Gammaproteobacteria bacterium]|nr:DoxX family protein [Gammaproteobacteria bacterium]
MTELTRNKLSRLLLRITLAGLIAAHGWFRLLHGGIEPFGLWLESQSIPFGFWAAAVITAVEILGSALLAIGLLVVPVCKLFIPLYVAGIVMVHANEGWFVVGAGRNGAEYSVLLIVALICVWLQHLPKNANYLN